MMKDRFQFKHPSFLIGMLFLPSALFLSCSQPVEEEANNDLLVEDRTFLQPVDSLEFDYTSGSKVSTLVNYSENRFGEYLFYNAKGAFQYASINSENELHTFDFESNEHSYSDRIYSGEIDAYMLDSARIYLLYDNTFFIKDYDLNTLDSFAYRAPVINQKHSIDFTVECHSNLFKLNDMYALMYYEVDELPDGTNLYRNTEKKFYFFNRDTAYFAGKGCDEMINSFQYFRYPTIVSDDEFIYHAPRVVNCISKSKSTETVRTNRIDPKSTNYLTINHLDQYEISKLKKYRYSTDYNRDLLVSDDFLFLIKEIPDKIYLKNNVRTYERILEVRKYDKNLKHIKTSYIEDKIYSYSFIQDERLFLFNTNENKALIYEI